MTIQEIKEKITPALRKHQIKRAGIFGSVATGKTTDSSDVDILVELGNEISLLDFVGIKYELEDLLGIEVDLVEYEAIKPRLKKRILSEEIRIYGWAACSLIRENARCHAFYTYIIQSEIVSRHIGINEKMSGENHIHFYSDLNNRISGNTTRTFSPVSFRQKTRYCAQARSS